MTAKTPDEIRKGLECCISNSCNDCPYVDEPMERYCKLTRTKDALAYIQQLEAQNAEVLTKVKQLQTERDAAVETIYEMAKCITEDVCEWCDGVECERLCMPHTILRPGFKWRGVQKEE